MTLPRRLEQVGIVVGSILMLSLPISVFTPLIAENITSWQTALLWLVPGLVVGVLVALDKFPASYHQVWAFCIASWLATIVLWAIFGVESVTADQSTALGTWFVALLVGALIAWVNPTVQWRRSKA